MEKNKPKINGKYFFNAIESINLILHRKTWNTMSITEREIGTIVADVITKAYLTKEF